MNCLFIKTAEFVECSGQQNLYEVSIAGQRAANLAAEHQLLPGLELSCVLQEKCRARLRILELRQDKIIAQAVVENLKIDRPAIRLAVAFARPQTMKKVMQLAASFGLSELNFIKTDRVVDSYLQSKVLLPEEIEDNFILGCQQSCDPFFPTFKKYYSLKSFIESCDSRTNLYFGDPASSVSVMASDKMANVNKTLLLGPESGFSAAEKALLSESGFEILSLGPRMLRVEVAASALIGRIL